MFQASQQTTRLCKNVLVRSLVILGIHLIISGCASTGVKMLPAMDTTTSQPGHGAVIATIVGAGGLQLPYNQLTIVPKDANNNKEYEYLRLESIDAVPGQSALFLSEVPVGEYALSSMRLYYSDGQSYLSRFRAAETEFGTFKVEENTVTNLGVLIYYPKSLDENYQETIIRTPQSSTHTRAYTPKLTGYTEQELTWNDDGAVDERHAEYIFSLQNPVLFSQDYLSDSGNTYFLSKLGVLIKFDSNNEWSFDAVDTNFDLHAVVELDNGGLVVGGDYGKIFVKPEPSADWQDVSLPASYTIEKLITQGKSVFAFTHRKGTVYIKEFTPNDQEKPWKTIRSFRYRIGWKDNFKQIILPTKSYSSERYDESLITSIRFNQLLDKNYLFISTREITDAGIFKKTDLNIFEVNLDNWSFTHSKGFGKGIDYITDAGTRKIGVNTPGFWSWTGKNAYYIHEENENSWKKIKARADFCPKEKKSKTICNNGGYRFKAFEFASLPLFMEDGTGVAFAHYTKGNGDRDGDIFVVTSHNGYTWVKTKHEPPQQHCIDSVASNKTSWLTSCNGASGDFYVSTDKGKTWEHTREHGSY